MVVFLRKIDRMKFWLPLLAVLALLLLVGRYFVRQITQDKDPRYGDGSNIIPGSIQSSTAPRKPKPLITAAERDDLTRNDEEYVSKIEEPPSQKPKESKAQRLKGNKADMKRAFLMQWLLERYKPPK
jgi:hypothetical protein